jgi:CheY-like chemotaxis protein
MRAQRDRAVEAERRQAEFISHASHEIRTPLHGIVGYTTLLLRTPLNGEQRAAVQALRTGIDALLDVVNDVLDVSQLEAGAMCLDSLGFNLTGLIQSVAETWRGAAEAKGLTLTADTALIAHPYLVGDPGRIRQVLNNLTDNAIKFTDAGGVTLRAETGRAASGGVTVCVSVIDTGAGIRLDDQERLFKPFSRLRRPAGANKSGAGLGLAISKQLVELMGGRLEVNTVSGNGSSFSLTVNLPEDPAPAVSSRLDLFDSASLRVYVADDDARSCEEIVRSLADIGIAPVGSGSAARLPEALRAVTAKGAGIDIAVVGHVAQKGTDLAIAQALRADPRLAAVALILAPVSGVRGHAREAREAGYDAYLPRPFRGVELRQCVEAVAAGRPAGLPAGEANLVTRHAIAESPYRGRRVLVADDDAVNRRVTRLQLEHMGFHVDEAVSGAEAVSAAARTPYDVILMDCQMPDMDGAAAAAAIRQAEPPGRRTVIAALTADLSAERRHECQQAGMDEFVEKPIAAPALEKMLKAIVPGAGIAVDALQLIIDEIGTEITFELVSEYLANAGRAIAKLERSGRIDADHLKRTTHRLVGGARTLGLLRLERLWQSCAASAEALPAARPALAEQLRRACADVHGWMDARRRNLRA